MTRSLRVGWLPLVYGIVAVLFCVGELALWITREPVALRMSVDPTFAIRVLVGGGAACTLVMGLGIAMLVLALLMQRGTPGRARLVMLAISGMLASLTPPALVAIAVWLVASASDPMIVDEITELQWGIALLVFAGATITLTLVSAVSTWFLVAPQLRKRAWVVIDVALIVAVAVVTVLLPISPPASAPDALEGPVLRLVVTVLFAIRAAVRVTRPLLELLETTGFQALLAARLLRAGKSGFLTIISLLAIGAVTVSSCALTTTLSVMGGFRDDLKRKILGNHAHVVIDRDHGGFEAWQPTVDAARRVPGVIGASPYVSGEVMVSSASNLSGAVLHGIDPRTIGSVTELGRNMRAGRLDYLEHPERLLDLPADELRGALLPLRRRPRTGRSSPPGGAKRDSFLDHVIADLPDAGPMRTAPSGRKDDDDLDEFLLDAEPGGGPAQGREVLPGIVVGQELARSLRLYVGDEVNVVSPLGDLGPAGPVPKSRPFRVAGIFYSGMYEYDMKYCYVLLPTAQQFLSTGDAITGIEIKVGDVDQAPAIARAVKRAIHRSGLRVRDWQELNRNLFGALALEKLAMFITLGIAIVVAGFCVLGTLMLMVQEKGREVAILKAMGGRDSQIVGLFLLEGALIGTIGAAIGLGLGYVACFAAEHFGIKMNPEVYYIDKLPVHVDGLEFVAVAVAAIVVCTLAAVFPAVPASRLRPVDALRYQ